MGLPFVARIVSGIVLVALVVGIGLFAERQTDDELALPDAVNGLPLDDTASSRELAENNSDALSEASDDAEAVTAVYGTDPGSRLLVSAVRAKSGPPVPAVFTENQEWVEKEHVQCLVTPLRKRAETIVCQRGGGDLTVRVLASGPDEPGIDSIIDATNEVWEDLS